jgi:hypothetical protein
MKLTRKRSQPYEYTDPASGAQYFSCSQVLAVLEPNLYAGVEDAVLELAAQRGIDLHRFFFYSLASLKRLCPKPPMPETFPGYAVAIWKWIEDFRPEPILLEDASIDDKRGIAGTPDAKLWVAKKIDMLELKTTSQQHRIHEVQLNCYRLFKDYQDVQTMHGLYIHDDGTYDYVPVYREPLHVAAIDNAVNVLRWRMAG